MKLIWPVIIALALVVLAVIQFFHNLPKMVYNVFHKTKKKVYWDPMEESRMGYDVTESFYHD